MNDDTVKCTIPFKYEPIGLKLYLDAILPVTKDIDGEYTLRFMFPDCFYFPDKPTIMVVIYGFETKQLLLKEVYYSVDKGSQLRIPPGHYLFVVYIEDDTYIIELK